VSAVDTSTLEVPWSYICYVFFLVISLIEQRRSDFESDLFPSCLSELPLIGSRSAPAYISVTSSACPLSAQCSVTRQNGKMIAFDFHLVDPRWFAGLGLGWGSEWDNKIVRERVREEKNEIE
jgi:hypothetical protein